MNTAPSASWSHRLRGWRDRLLLQEDLNFLLTNRIPRIAVTRFMGWFSRIRHPWLAAVSIAVWRLFTDLDLRDARKARFESLHDCFTRELVPGARAIDANAGALVSPCDAIVGACGAIDGQTVWQAKGFPYTLTELAGGDALAPFRGGTFVTLRLTSAMYHRFHAPDDLRLTQVDYLSGDTWNVNPIALQRVEKLFCRNERAVLSATLVNGGQPIAIVAVAAVLVASIRLHALDVRLHLRYRGPHRLTCDAPARRGEELGWFEHGSTLIVFVPPGFALQPGVTTGTRLRMGQPLLQRLPAAGEPSAA